MRISSWPWLSNQLANIIVGIGYWWAHDNALNFVFAKTMQSNKKVQLVQNHYRGRNTKQIKFYPNVNYMCSCVHGMDDLSYISNQTLSILINKILFSFQT